MRLICSIFALFLSLVSGRRMMPCETWRYDRQIQQTQHGELGVFPLSASDCVQINHHKNKGFSLFLSFANGSLGQGMPTQRIEAQTTVSDGQPNGCLGQV